MQSCALKARVDFQRIWKWVLHWDLYKKSDPTKSHILAYQRWGRLVNIISSCHRLLSADSDGHHIPSTWLNEGRDIADLQQTLFDYKALPSLKGAASSSLGFIADIPAMGYATYFVGPAPAGDAKKAIPLSAAKRWTVDGTSGLDDIAVDGRVVIGNDKMNLVLSANNGSLLSMRTRYACF